MSAFDFDTPVDRTGTASVKWDRYGGRDVLPLWVADMDFAAPPAVGEALARRVRHGVFGYTHAGDSLVEAIRAHARERYGWEIDPRWFVYLPGAVPTLNAAARLIGADARVVTTTPIYPPFLSAPGHMGRPSVRVPLAAGADGYQRLDLDALEDAFADGGSLFFLCNPYNPGGRVFTQGELEALGERVLRHDTLVVSDELHADLVLEPEHRHRPLAALDPALAARTITLLAPSKTFNLAGLGFAFAVIPDPGLRERFRAAIDGILPYVNLLGYTAAEAAYRHGGAWHAELLAYLRANRDRVTEALARFPGVRAVPPEGTYLYWMDMRATGLEDPARHFESHGVGLSNGADFGAPGFVRLNFACPRVTLDAALARMAGAFNA